MTAQSAQLVPKWLRYGQNMGMRAIFWPLEYFSMKLTPFCTIKLQYILKYLIYVQKTSKNGPKYAFSPRHQLCITIYYYTLSMSTVFAFSNYATLRIFNTVAYSIHVIGRQAKTHKLTSSFNNKSLN